MSAGDKVIVTDWPAREGSHQVRVRTILLEDGHSFALYPGERLGNGRLAGSHESRIDTMKLRDTLIPVIGFGLLLSLGACGGGGGGESVAPPVATADTVPDSFGFGERLSVPSGSVIESDPITVTGIDGPAVISVAGGEYSIEGGAYTSGAGTVTNGQTVRVRHTSSADPATTVTTVLTIGGVNGTFSSTTASMIAPQGGFLSSSVVLGRPTDSSISISVLVAEAIDAYVEYRTDSAGYEPAPDPVVPRTIQANEPFVFELEGLVADTQYSLSPAVS